MTELETTRPLPEIKPDDVNFWKGTKNHELVLPHCDECGKVFYYPRSRCPGCLSDKLSWKKVSGKGIVYSYTIVRRAPFKEFVPPYVLALIKLDEGPIMMSNIVDCEVDEVSMEAPVEVTFEDVTEAITLPNFKLSK